MSQLNDEESLHATRETPAARSTGSTFFAALGRKGRVGVAGLVVTAAFALGLAAGTGYSGGANDAVAESSLTGRAEFATLEKTWELIHEKWPEPDQIDDSALIYGAAKGMVEAIGDEGHS